MKNIDLTIIFLTTNRVPEKWAKFHKERLLEAAWKYPIISISCKPVDIWTNIIQSEPLSKSNIFYQMLRWVRMVKTKYVAIAEDDTLYTKEHFDYRPRENEFAYNQHKWSLYTWNPVYNLKNFLKTNAVMICETKLALEALEERFVKYPHDMENMPIGMCWELWCYEDGLWITPRKAVWFKTDEPVVQLDHDFFTPYNKEKETTEHRHQKELGTIQAYDIPIWWRSGELIKMFK